MLQLSHFHVSVSGKNILGPLDLIVKPGRVHAVMGPNGSGKSSLALALMGHPDYQLGPKSLITLDGVSLIGLTPPKRAHLGLFLAFQTSIAIPGVSIQNALKAAYEAIHCSGCTEHLHCPKLSVSEFRANLKASALSLNLDPSFLVRPLNDGFSGGEKKRLELLSLLTLKPKYAILDETDSGLDIDSISLVARTLKQLVDKPKLGVLLITHNHRLFDHHKPDSVSILIKGQLVASAGPELITQIEKQGFKSFQPHD